MKKLLFFLSLAILTVFISRCAHAQNECPSGSYAPSWGKFTDSSGVTHQTVCIDINAKLSFPLLNSITPTTMSVSGTGSVGTPAYSIAGVNSPGIFNDTGFLGLGIVYGGATRIYVFNGGTTFGTSVIAGASSIGVAPDVGLNRCAAGRWCVGNGTANDTSGSLNATDYLISGAASSGTGALARVNGPAIASPTFNTGMSQGSGLKHQRFGASCTTGAAVGAACNTTYTWTSAWADANYTVSCTVSGSISGEPIVINISTKSASSFLVSIAAFSAVAAQASSVDCIAMHD